MGVNLTQKPTQSPVLKRVMMPFTWTGFGYTVRMLPSVLTISVDNELATCGIPALMSCVMIVRVAGAGMKRKNMTLNQCRVLLKAHAGLQNC
jgi:hypothetical protein